MAEKYEITFASLLMPEPLPPSTRLTVTDFRTYGGEGVLWGPELLAAIDEINIGLDSLSDLRSYSPNLFIAPALPSATLEKSPVILARNERNRVGLSVKMQLEWGTESEAFRRLRSLIEAQGVFVYVIKADTQEHWRGLTIYDERRLPFIVINGDEPRPGRRTFSLFHEYAHVLLRISAISGGRPKSAIERFCNQFAAHFLMPRDEFVAIARFINRNPSGDWEDAHIKLIADKFKLSMSAVALHLEDLGLAPEGFYNTRRSQWQNTGKSSSSGFVNYYDKVVNRHGDRLVNIILQARERGILDDLDANEILNVSPTNFHRLGQVLKERQAAYGWEW